MRANMEKMIKQNGKALRTKGKGKTFGKKSRDKITRANRKSQRKVNKKFNNPQSHQK